MPVTQRIATLATTCSPLRSAWRCDQEATLTDRQHDTANKTASPELSKMYRSRLSRRIATQAERIAAARVRVAFDPERGVETPQWIVELAKQGA